jgi:hypothetical protein
MPIEEYYDKLEIQCLKLSYFDIDIIFINRTYALQPRNSPSKKQKPGFARLFLILVKISIGVCSDLTAAAQKTWQCLPSLSNVFHQGSHFIQRF